MRRVIDEDDVLKALCRELCHPGAICPDGYCEEMREKLKDVPTAHPEPPKMGEWKWDGKGTTVVCSQCGKGYDWYTDAQYYDYCPHCGAYMGGEG